MRIAQIAPLYESVPPRLYGGTERVVSWLTEKLVALGHQVTLFASGDSVTNARLVPCCKKALRLDSHCVDPFAAHVLMLEKVFRQAEAFDLIHSHVDYLPFSLSRRERVPCLTTLHGRLDIPELAPLYKEFREMPLVSISDSQRKPLPWANWIGTVHHGMPRDMLSLHESTGRYLAFLGRISPEKGLDHAIKIAIASGKKLRVAAKIDRADRDYYEKHIKSLMDHELVEFVGEIGNSEKDDFLGNAVALLFPIQWSEPFGLVMIEAMACGTPIIAYPSGSVPEVILNGVSGFPVNNIDEGVAAVHRVGKIDRRKCRQHFELNFTDDRMAHDYLKIYQYILHQESASEMVEEGVLNWMAAESSSPSTT
jgi:glycosyltransferase involved in cell wall biosynthesis